MAFEIDELAQRLHKTPMALVNTRVHQRSHRAENRFDFFYEQGTWGPRAELTSTISRSSATTSELTAYERTNEPDQARAEIRQRGVQDLKHLVTIMQWGYASIEQFAAITNRLISPRPDGTARYWSDMPRDLQRLRASGLIRSGVAFRGSRVPVILAPDRSHATDRFIDSLSPADRQVLLDGGSWTKPRQGARHTLLANEHLLRQAEFSDEPVVVHPEGLAGHARLGAPGSDRCGDGVITLSDTGARVVIEMTCSGDYKTLEPKVRGAVDLLRRTPDTAVLFIEATEPGRTSVWSPLKRAVQSVAIHEAAAGRSRLLYRLGITRWTWCYPGPGLISGWGRSTHCFMPTGDPTSPWIDDRIFAPWQPCGFPYPDHRTVAKFGDADTDLQKMAEHWDEALDHASIPYFTQQPVVRREPPPPYRTIRIGRGRHANTSAA